MALDFLRRDARDTRIVPTMAELELRINALSLELARANKRIDALVRERDGAAPTLEDADSARKIMAHIGRAIGHTGSPDTAHLPVRNALLKREEFAELRTALAAKGASIVADEKILRWLAEPSRMDGSRTRFAIVLSGDLTARALAVAER
jgi:hypothetical protein